MRWARAADGGRGLLRDERGAVAAEFAVVLPLVMVVLGLVIGGIALAAHRITLVSAAAEAARLEARGDEAAAASRIAALGGGVSVSRSGDGSLHCVVLSSSPGGGALSAIVLSARGCAATSDAAAEP